MTSFDYGGHFSWIATVSTSAGIMIMNGRVPRDEDEDGIADDWEERFLPREEIRTLNPEDDSDSDQFERHKQKGDRYSLLAEYRGLLIGDKHYRFDELPMALRSQEAIEVKKRGPKGKDAFLLDDPKVRNLVNLAEPALRDTGILWHFIPEREVAFPGFGFNESPTAMHLLARLLRVNVKDVPRSGIVNLLQVGEPNQVAIRTLDLVLTDVPGLGDVLGAALAPQWDSTAPVLVDLQGTNALFGGRDGVPLVLKLAQVLLHELGHRKTLQHKVRYKKVQRFFPAEILEAKGVSRLRAFVADPDLEAGFVTQTGGDRERIRAILVKVAVDLVDYDPPHDLEALIRPPVPPRTNEDNLPGLAWMRFLSGETLVSVRGTREAVLDIAATPLHVDTPLGLKVLVLIPTKGQDITKTVQDLQRTGLTPCLPVDFVQGEIMDREPNFLDLRENRWIRQDFARMQLYKGREILEIGQDEREFLKIER